MIVDFLKRHWWWILPLLIADIFLFRWILARPAEESGGAEPSAELSKQDVPVEDAELIYTYPTDQTNLHDTGSTVVYQPTASGRVASALHGTTRTVQRGGRIVPSFHAGIDIAALRRDRHGRPLDKVYAVADGTVAYVNRIGGNSSYGIYVVLTHQDPVGEIYTLYSHLASVAKEIRPGSAIRKGAALGVMGNTASTGIPMQRAHLHFEIGVVNNAWFHAWYKKKKLKPDHGTYHGYNLAALNPLAIYGGGEAAPAFSMLVHLRSEEPAFVLAFRHEGPLDYFKRYPALWSGPPHEDGAMSVAVSEGGVLLCGRPATPEEEESLGRRGHLVRNVVDDMGSHNGRGLILQRNGEWKLTRHGEQWLEIYSY